MKIFKRENGKKVRNQKTGDFEIEFIESGVWHNPTPTTERGKRRHQNRSDGDRKRVEALWNKTS
jgi:hypothetical protein